MTELTLSDIENLMRSVFSLRSEDKNLAIIVDVPDESVPDSPKWQERRAIAHDWYEKLTNLKSSLSLEKVNIFYYPNVHNNNADLPETAYFYSDDPSNLNASTLSKNGEAVNFMKSLSHTQLILALTQFSATAPLKLLAKKYNFRAATMPGFSVAMVPALKLNYEEINRRVSEIKQRLDPADSVDIEFSTEDGEKYEIHFDLRFREAHASGGRFPDPGTAGNLPSGECYIVPYEGEKTEKSESAGMLPVQFDEEIVVYKIDQNVAKEIMSKGNQSKLELEKITEEPAYANIAEIGFGVLKDFGVNPTGEILLDEKLGLHIAFGRSDHFGGNVGVKDFTKPENVVHIDRIYIPETQPKISVKKVVLNYKDEKSFTLMKQGEYTLF